NMKQEIINDMATQIDDIHAKKKREDVDVILTEFYHSCRRKKDDCTCRGLSNITEGKEDALEFKMIEMEDGKVFCVAQWNPWMPRQG
ncbi:hypothetical protein KI387_006328, partial [Taxus chinensis]